MLSELTRARNEDELQRQQYQVTLLNLQQHVELMQQKCVDPSGLSLETLRQRQLQQSRMEVQELASQLQLQVNVNHEWQHKCKLLQINHEHQSKAFEHEHARLVRELRQHQLLYQGRGRQIQDSQLQLQSLQTKFTHSKQCLKDDLKRCRLETEQKEFCTYTYIYAHIHIYIYIYTYTYTSHSKELESLKRVNQNLKEEMESLLRFNHKPSQNLEALTTTQQQEMEQMKIRMREEFLQQLNEQQLKYRKLQELLYSSNEQALPLQNTVKALEQANAELRLQLQHALAVNDNVHAHSDSFQCEIGVQTNECVLDTKLNPFDPLGASNVDQRTDDLVHFFLEEFKEEFTGLRQTNARLMDLLHKRHTDDNDKMDMQPPLPPPQTNLQFHPPKSIDPIESSHVKEESVLIPDDCSLTSFSDHFQFISPLVTN
ncbi:hypothetical protein RFI_13703 [Reticulomyxa filosa]|uniref:Uncharacterized protein n=1 Tax=Reticulomyxa filosa TaxID=46433 RepID=X6NCJ2_RETFI|nr:hypothetical protein RFI_13703 [Reticulomyxa filosa]|eukprot:ETO23479.1 hypothetical protein RFI_13703 [Reticulomyxa filosa]